MKNFRLINQLTGDIIDIEADYFLVTSDSQRISLFYLNKDSIKDHMIASFPFTFAIIEL